MTEQPREPRLSDQQMDHLLGAFYKLEVPQQLTQVPSDWAGVQDSYANTNDAPATKSVTVAVTEDSAPLRGASALGRSIVVAVAALAAGVTIMILSQHTGQPVSPINTAEKGVDEAASGEVNVSQNPGGNDGGVVGEDGLTVIELDVDLESPTPNKKLKQQKP